MTWRGRNIYLIGLPGSGKSSVGSELVRLIGKAGYEFVDLDEAIEKRSGKRIREIFEIDGESTFRESETRELLEYSNRSFTSRPVVLATGGGTVVRDVNRAIMRGSGIVVWIDVNVRQAAKRVLQEMLQGNVRPLLRASSPEDLTTKMRNLLTAREKYYEQATLHFVTKGARGDERSPAELAVELLKALEEMSRHVRLRPRFHSIIAKSGLGDYPVHIGNGIGTSELSAAIKDSGANQVAIITDRTVAKLNTARLTKLAQELAPQTRIHQIVLDPGEGNKNFDTLIEVLNSLFKLELPRKGSLVVTIGGGVVSDLGGFATSIYLRGLPLIHVPTTLLAQVDAALGGKTGIDYFGSKNSLGSFYPPRMVIVDPLYLRTLHKRQLHSGLAEVFKYALIGSRPMWQDISKSVRRLIRGLDSAYENIIRLSIEQKLRYVERDEFERHHGGRELLNFGHTFAHALEAASQFNTFLHGEAVLLGMRAAAWLSHELGYMSEEDWREIEIVLGRIPIAATTGVSSGAVFDALGKDKKRSAKGIRLVLLRGIGEALSVEKVPETSIREAIEFMLSLI
jgi:3-dehydroquinate synthase